MEKTLNSHDDKEFMRMAMLKHEETFREQVNELHRLYRIQKMLMESVGLNQQHQQQKQKLERYNLVESSKKAFTIDHYQQQLILQAQAQRQREINSTNMNDKSKFIISSTNNNVMGLNLMGHETQVVRGPRSSDAQEHIAETNGNDDDNNNNNNNNKLTRLDEDEIELTLSLGLGPATCNPRRRKTGNSESGQSISSSSTGSSQTKKNSPKQNNNDTSNRSPMTWGSFPQGSGIEPGFSNSQQNSNNPPWLYQALSLKLT